MAIHLKYGQVYIDSLVMGIKKIILLICVLALPLPAFGGAKGAFKAIKPLIFQIKTSQSANMSKNSYGTGFVVDPSGLIITNYHVVSSHVWRPESNQIYAMIDNKSVKAELLKVDFVNDLALLKVDHKFKGRIPFAKRKLSQGALIYSLGLPADVSWTVVEGEYNDFTFQGPYKQVFMSTPLNGGMSGGPTVNAKNELVAVNVSVLFNQENISFGVPLEYVKKLIAEYRKSGPSDNKTLIKNLNTQMVDIQNKLTEKIVAAFNNPKPIDHWNWPKFDSSVRCWGNQSQDPEIKKEIFKEESCRVKHNISVAERYIEGYFDSTFTAFVNKKMPVIGFNARRSVLWNDSGSGVVQEVIKNSKIKYEPVKCIRERIALPNEKGKPKTISICTQKIDGLEGLYDAYIKLNVDLDVNSFLRGEVMLAGFTKENIKKVTKKILGFHYSNPIKVLATKESAKLKRKPNKADDR